jgi:hypothetical protein
VTRSELERLGFTHSTFAVGATVPDWIAYADPPVPMTWALAVDVYRRDSTRPLVFPVAPIAFDATGEIPIPSRASLFQRLREAGLNSADSQKRGPALALTRTALAPFVTIELTSRATQGIVLCSAVWNYEPLNAGRSR